jgi:acetylornithine deacetylase
MAMREATSVSTSEHPRLAEILPLLQKLIAFPTVSRDSNLELIAWIREILQAHGVASELTYDEGRTKANLFATIGPAIPGGVLLSGHTDVVPVDGQSWDTDPFQMHVADGRAYGRGACDMKGFIAVILANVGRLCSAPLRRPVHLAFTYDEEVGCKGVRTLLAGLEQSEIRPNACIVGEPTSMRVVTAHKGSRNYRCCVRGQEAHASRIHEGVNAIQHAARIISRIEDVAEQLQQAARRDSEFDTPYDTLQTALVHGGLARNIVPRDCEFTFGYRYLPDTDPDGIFASVRDYAESQVLPRMKARAPAASIEFEKQSDNPALEAGPNTELAQYVLGLTGQDAVGQAVSYMTEGGLYQRAGIPTVICGPGSIQQAHKPNEYVELEQLALCDEFIRNLSDQAADFRPKGKGE